MYPLSGGDWFDVRDAEGSLDCDVQDRAGRPGDFPSDPSTVGSAAVRARKL